MIFYETRYFGKEKEPCCTTIQTKMVLYIEEKQVSNQEHVVDISSVVKS